ncbi:MAG: hypothetical protein SGPRY_007337 [Prymnesium sp.]
MARKAPPAQQREEARMREEKQTLRPPTSPAQLVAPHLTQRADQPAHSSVGRHDAITAEGRAVDSRERAAGGSVARGEHERKKDELRCDSTRREQEITAPPKLQLTTFTRTGPQHQKAGHNYQLYRQSSSYNQSATRTFVSKNKISQLVAIPITISSAQTKGAVTLLPRSSPPRNQVALRHRLPRIGAPRKLGAHPLPPAAAQLLAARLRRVQ